MVDLRCPACGARASEYDLQCPVCGADLPDDSLPGHALADPTAGEVTLPAVPGAPRKGDPLVGSRVSHFQILGALGRGGMGVVYRATDLELGREVALKFLAPGAARPKDIARFRREAQAAASLDHPNIGTVHEVGEHQGRPFLAMALYEGETLARRLEREEPLPVAEAISVAAQIASALAAAHGRGIVHRDLKPSNLVLTRDGRVKLLDFGIARLAGASTLTEEGVLVGTVAYMAPERLGGDVGEGSDAGDASNGSGARADLWSLGVVLYEMLAGRRPFEPGRRGLLHAILQEKPPPLHSLRPDVPPELERIVARCLEKDPDRRWADAGEVLAALRPLGADLDSTLSTLSSFSPLRRGAAVRWGVAAAAGLLLGVGGIAAWRLSRPAPPPLTVAVLAPEVSGTATREQRALMRSNLQVAALRTLTALEGVAPMDPSQWQALAAPPAATAQAVKAIARAVAAQEVLAIRADCTPDLCQVELRRLDGGDGRVLWAAPALQLPAASTRISAEALAATVRQAYAGRELRFSALELEVAEVDYRRYLDLLQRLERGRPEELLGELEALRRRSPRFLDVYYLEGRTAYRLFRSTGDPQYLDRGLELAEKAKELAPDDPRPFLNLADFYLAAGRLDEARAALARLEVLAPESAAMQMRRSYLAERQGRMDEALALMRKAVERQPSAQNLSALANLEYRLGRLGDARHHLEALLVRVPDHVDGLSTLAQIELLDGDPGRAVGTLRRLVRKSPGAPGPLTNLGVALMLLRRYGEAEGVLRQALALSPDDPAVAYNLADSLLLQGRGGEARTLYSGVVDRIEATEAPPWMLLSTEAQALAHLGESRRAVEVIQRALRESPDNAQLACEASLVYVLVGDRSSALVHAQKALASGVSPVWFRFPWFDPLRGDPAFAALVHR